MVNFSIGGTMGLFAPSKKDKKSYVQKKIFFKEMISDGLRHKSKLAGKHMRDLKDYKNGKY